MRLSKRSIVLVKIPCLKFSIANAPTSSRTMQHEQRIQPDSTSRHWRHNGIPSSPAYRQAVGQELAVYCSLAISKSLETGHALSWVPSEAPGKQSRESLQRERGTRATGLNLTLDMCTSSVRISCMSCCHTTHAFAQTPDRRATSRRNNARSPPIKYSFAVLKRALLPVLALVDSHLLSSHDSGATACRPLIGTC